MTSYPKKKKNTFNVLKEDFVNFGSSLFISLICHYYFSKGTFNFFLWNKTIWYGLEKVLFVIFYFEMFWHPKKVDKHCSIRNDISQLVLVIFANILSVGIFAISFYNLKLDYINVTNAYNIDKKTNKETASDLRYVMLSLYFKFGNLFSKIPVWLTLRYSFRKLGNAAVLIQTI